MRQATVFIVLSILLSFTTVLYTFATPESLKHKTVIPNRARYWAKPDSDFNWCEDDHTMSEYVAEPFNTASSLLYWVCAGFGLYTHWRVITLDLRYCFSMFIVFCVGTGSALFHGTLLYSMQLLDELPMHALVMLACWSLWERHETTPNRVRPIVVLCALESALVGVLMFVARDEFAHQAMRAVMSTSFSIGFIYIFTAGAGSENEVVTMSGRPNRLFTVAFYLFVFAIFCWVLDIVACPFLHALPLGLPYPQTHALGWHGCTSLGLYFLWLLQVMHRQLVLGDQVKLRWRLGVLPVLSLGKDQ